MTAEMVAFFWAPLSVLLVGLLLTAYEASRRANNKADTIQKEATKLLAQLEKEVADRNHLLNQIRAHYEERIERKEQKIKDVNWSHEEWEKGMDKLFAEWAKMPPSPAVIEQRKKVEALLREPAPGLFQILQRAKAKAEAPPKGPLYPLG